MNIFLNPASTPPAVQLKATGSPLASMRLKRGAVVPLVVTMMGVQNATNLRFGIRAAHEGEMLALASADSGTAADNGTSFTLSLEVRSNALDAALHVGDAATSLAKLVCMSEFAWMEGDEQRLSDTIATTILNDIVRLASESPDALSALYPAPDTLATKAWVRELRASSSAAGLVLLESDAVLEGEHTAVALTAAGAIAVPRATSDESGTVILGTDEVLSGLHVLPVGKDQAGKLAVDASGLSAYDIAVKNGFVGTQEDWLDSLKGEPGEPGPDGLTAEQVNELIGEALVQPTTDIPTPSGTDDCSYVYADIPAKYIMAGSLHSIILQGASTVGNGYASPAYLVIWQEQAAGTDNFQPVAVSTNAVTVQANTPNEWLFDSPLLLNERIRFYLSDTPTLEDGFNWGYDRKLRSRVMPTQRWQDGHLFTPDTLHCIPEMLIRINVGSDKFASKRHEKDTTIHLSAEEHSALLELLARKDEILATLPTATALADEGEQQSNEVIPTPDPMTPQP